MSSSNNVVLYVKSIINTKTMVIVDESSYIKGPTSIRTRRITYLSKKAKFKLIMTGTPVSQGLVDLYSQFNFLSSSILGYLSFYAFRAKHIVYHEKFKDKIKDYVNVEYISRRIKPYVYQVTKDECLDLPPKIFQTFYFELKKQQRLIYEQIKQEFLSEVSLESGFNSVEVLKLFNKLQQVACGFIKYKDEKGKISTETCSHCRTDILVDIIKQIPPQNKIIIWAKYKHDIEQIVEALTCYFSKEEYSLFHGGILPKKRESELSKFKNGTARFLISTPSCGGFGLTLNESSYTIFYSQSFKYGDRIQAEDRNHRIGQNKKVTYINIVGKNTIDEIIMKSITQKSDVVEDFKAELEKIKTTKQLKNKILSI